MSTLLSLVPRVRTLKYVLVAVIAFSLGGATVVQAVAPGGIAGVVQLADRTDNTRLAAVDANGNVSVAATQAGAWSVRDVDAPALTPIVLRGGTVCTDPARFCVVTLATTLGGSPYAVPAGKRLAVEMVSAEINLQGGEDLSFVEVSVTNPLVNVWLAPERLGTTEGVTTAWVATSLVRMYADPGAHLAMAAVKVSSSAAVRDVEFTLIGHLVNVP